MRSILSKLVIVTTPRARPWLFAYVISVILGSILETCGVGMIFVFFQAVLDPGRLAKILPVGWLGISSDRDPTLFLVILSAMAIGIYALRTLAVVAGNWFSLTLRDRLHSQLSDMLFSAYLGQPYLWHLSVSRTRLFQNVTNNSGAVVKNALIASIEICGLIILVMASASLLAWLRPVETIAVLLFFGLLVAANLFIVRGRSVKWGALALEASEGLVRVTNEALEGIKTVKVMGLERHFRTLLSEKLSTFLALFVRQGMLLLGSRLIFEIAVVILLFGGVMLSLLAGRAPAEVVPTLILFGASAYRLVPAIARTLELAQNFRMSLPALEVLADDLSKVESWRRENLGRSKAGNIMHEEFRDLGLDEVGFIHPESRRRTLQNVTFRVARGEVVCIAGPSGAGKTTAVDILLGLLPPTTGRVLLNGVPMGTPPAGFFGYVPQDPFVSEDTLISNVAIGVPSGQIDRRKVEDVLSLVALDDVVGRLPGGISGSLRGAGGSLSGGQRQRLGLARALYFDPTVLILDEPTSALDSETEAAIMKVIWSRRGRMTVIVIAHRLSTVQNFDRVLFLDDGELTGAGRFGELYSTHERFRRMVDNLVIHSVPSMVGGARS
jgi:ABC-type multidrug transport system fused ATPase/permease subunit